MRKTYICHLSIADQQLSLPIHAPAPAPAPLSPPIPRYAAPVEEKIIRVIHEHAPAPAPVHGI